jgi:hypothetical protein
MSFFGKINPSFSASDTGRLSARADRRTDDESDDYSCDQCVLILRHIFTLM